MYQGLASTNGYISRIFSETAMNACSARRYSEQSDALNYTNTRFKMHKILKVISIAASLGVVGVSPSANAWWGGGPGNGNFFGDGSGGFNMNMSGNGYGNGYGYNNPYGYGAGPWGGYPGYGMPYGGGYGAGPWAGYPGSYGMPHGGYGVPYNGGGYPYAPNGYPGMGRMMPGTAPEAVAPNAQ
jgi:hypothetical protein